MDRPPGLQASGGVLFGALQRKYISEFLPLDDMHRIHTFAGKVVGFEVISHSFWHLHRV